MPTQEYNFDGLVGPTHNYAGLSYGNLASMKNANQTSNPRAAALEGLEKMRFVASLGVKQAILPPHERPHLPTLRRLGYSGSDAQILEKVAKEDPVLLAMVSSASSMWTANAATISPSADTGDARVHFTPANLLTQFHRSIEPPETGRILRTIFADEKHFVVHDPLPATSHFADEGAANHTRLWGDRGGPGIEIFCHGRNGFDPSQSPSKYPARQTREAGEAIARLHGLAPHAVFHVQQNLAAVNAGAFHNDVVCVGHRNILLLHQQAFADGGRFLGELRARFEDVCSDSLEVIVIAEEQLSLQEAVQTYLFNSQLLLRGGRIALIAPMECNENSRVSALCEEVLQSGGPISEIHFVDVRQSMRNGGGPACLRLRIMLSDAESAAMHQGVILTDPLVQALRVWVTRHYREELAAEDLADPSLLRESRDALDELTRLLGLGNLYEFQSI